MRTRLVLSAMALAVTGCAPPGFARLGPFQLAFTIGGERGEVAFLAYNDGVQGCQKLDDDFTATANGAETKTFPGGSNLFSGFRCSPPEIQFGPPRTPADGVTLEISSGEDRVIATVEGLGQIIDGSLLGAPGALVHPGDPIRVALGPGFDRVRWPPFSSLVAVEQSGQVGTEIDVASPSASGVIDVQLPAALPPGRAHLEMSWDNLPTFPRCEGAGGCTWFTGRVVIVSLDLAFDVSP